MEASHSATPKHAIADPRIGKKRGGVDNNVHWCMVASFIIFSPGPLPELATVNMTCYYNSLIVFLHMQIY